MNGPEILLTWVDVARKLGKISQPVGEPEPSLPPGLVFTQTFWDRLLVGVEEGRGEEVLQWLAGVFAPRWLDDADGHAILLEAEGEDLSRLPVVLEDLSREEAVEWRSTSYQPRFAPARTAHFSKIHEAPPLALPADQPPVLAFHSFKGGVGRTLCALATTLAYTGQGKKILLVDADFEAPGISFLFEERMPDADYSLADLLTMLHADGDPDGGNALQSAVKGVTNQHLDGVYVLPCFRNLEDSVSLEIRPEHLVASTAHSPFFLTDVLSRLGKALGVDVVIVDLRAGLSELSAPLILDPRVNRVLVSNVSGQSIKGTRFLLKAIGGTIKMNKWPADNLPAFILNQIPGSLLPLEGNERFQAINEDVNDALQNAFSDNDQQDDGGELIDLTSVDVGIARANISFVEPLTMLPSGWEKAMATIRSSLVPDKVWDSLQQWLPRALTDEPEPVETISAQREGGKAVTLDDRRRMLRDFAGNMVTAEGAGDDRQDEVDFLPIKPLLALANDHATKMPMVVSIGAKGAGKTYAFLRIVLGGVWAEFVKKANPGLECALDAPVFPLLWGASVDPLAMESQQRKCRETLRLPGQPAEEPYDLRRKLSDFQRDEHDLFAWRDFWLDAIARVMGIPGDEPKPFAALLAHLRNNGLSLVAAVDGLEENFDEFATNETQQTALRALLQEVPNWLRTLPGTPLGIIIFVRQDMVLHAIPQNRVQFAERHKSYALRWTWNEALELAAWVCDRSKATDGLWSEDFSSLSENRRTTRLEPLWGYKLGGKNTNEAISNNWILSVLSDLRGKIQGRDVVRFLHYAAKYSVDNTKTTDRLLAPTAIRDAIGPCSEVKVEELGQENTPLKNVFNKIREGGDLKSPLLSPCDANQLAKLGLDESQVELMEENGVLFFSKEDKKYFFPEIFREGLGIGRAQGARPRVVSLMRQARNQG